MTNKMAAVFGALAGFAVMGNVYAADTVTVNPESRRIHTTPNLPEPEFLNLP